MQRWFYRLSVVSSGLAAALVWAAPAAAQAPAPAAAGAAAQAPVAAPDDDLVTGPAADLIRRAADVAADKPDDAVALLKQAVGVDAKSAAAHNNLGIIAARRGRFDEARASFAEALRLRPEYADAVINMARAYEMEGRFQEAASFVDGAAQRIDAAYGLSRLDPDRDGEVIAKLPLRAKQIWLYRGSLAARGNPPRYDEAIRIARRILKLDETSIEARVLLGEVFALQRKWELARKVLGDAIDLAEKGGVRRPAVSQAYALQGRIAINESNRARAREFYRKALELSPDDVPAAVNTAVFLNEAGSFDEALKVLNRAASVAPGVVATYVNRGNTLRGLARGNDALADYETARRLDPANTDAVFNLGVLHMEFARAAAALDDRERLYKEAIAFFEDFRTRTSAPADDPAAASIRRAKQGIDQVVRERKKGDAARKRQEEEQKIREMEERERQPQAPAPAGDAGTPAAPAAPAPTPAPQ